MLCKANGHVKGPHFYLGSLESSSRVEGKKLRLESSQDLQYVTVAKRGPLSYRFCSNFLKQQANLMRLPYQALTLGLNIPGF